MTSQIRNLGWKLSIWTCVAALLGCQGLGTVDYSYSDPETSVSGEAIGETYDAVDGWYVSPVLEAPSLTTRAAVLLEVGSSHEDVALRIEAQGVREGGGEGEWIPLEESFRQEQYRTAHADLGFEAAGLRIRLLAAEIEAIASLHLAAANPRLAAAIDQLLDEDDDLDMREQALTSGEQAALGTAYRSRAAWGARAARSCSGDVAKYRMAIHMTGTGTSVSNAAIRSVQDWHMTGRGWCDIGYHYLVNRDGTVFQGRVISRLGAHVAPNNTGNIGISLVGCYDTVDPYCERVNRSTGSSVVPSAAIIESTGRLVRVLSDTHGIAIERSRILGHGEHPGSASTCPGDNILARMSTILDIARGQGGPEDDCERDDLVFTDIGCSPFMDDILWLEEEGLTRGCGGGRYCPDDPLTRGQAAVFLQRALDLPPGPAVFSDVEGHPHADAIHAVAAAGITGGCGGSNFCPDQRVTRGQVATFLARSLNLPETTGSFADVAPDDPHAAAIYSIVAVGMSQGCSSDSFCPAGVVTRGHMARFMRGAVEYLRANCHEPSSMFIDIGCSLFKDDIEWIAEEGITSGCGGLRYCPGNTVTRAQMATFLARSLNLPPGPSVFSDVSGNHHEDHINAIAAAGITSGCGGGRYCPDDPVTRAQMATFLSRALGLPPGPAVFTDVEGNPHEDHINAIAAAGITSGCGNGRYCPDQDLDRGQMARFLNRAFR